MYARTKCLRNAYNIVLTAVLLLTFGDRPPAFWARHNRYWSATCATLLRCVLSLGRSRPSTVPGWTYSSTTVRVLVECVVYCSLEASSGSCASYEGARMFIYTCCSTRTAWRTILFVRRGTFVPKFLKGGLGVRHPRFSSVFSHARQIFAVCSCGVACSCQ